MSLVQIAHAWSSDLGIPWSEPYDAVVCARGWSVTHFTPPGPHAQASLGPNRRWVRHSLQRRLHPPSDIIGAAELYRHFRRGRFDIVHTHATKVGLVGRVCATAARTPIIVHTMHGLAYSLETPVHLRTLHSILERLASLRVDAILAQSREDAHTIRATGVIDPKRVHWVGNGINLTRFKADALVSGRKGTRESLGVNDSEVLFLTAGRLVREKGIVELFEAAARARAKDGRVRLAVAGAVDSAKADALDDATLQAARNAGVLILGPRNDMPELYAAADAVILASWREGMPRVLMEASAMRLPLIASDARGCRELVDDGINGFQTRVRDAASIEQALLRMTGSPELRDSFGAENLRRGAESFDVEVVARRVADIYDALLARR